MLTRRYGLEQEDVGGQAGSAAEWKRRVRELNGSEWREEISRGNEQFEMVQGSEGCFWCGKASLEGHEAIRLRFRLRTGL